MSASSGAGSISLALPHAVSAVFDLESGVGSIEVDPSLGLEVDKRTIGASVHGTVGGGGPNYRLSTGVGSIEVSVGASGAVH